jgi:acetyl esterase/lipase
MQQALRQAGVQAAVLLLPYADHAFDLFGTGWSPTARQALWHAERFLELVASNAESPSPSPEQRPREFAMG